MEIPRKVPGLRWLTVLLGVFFVIWIAPEGDLQRVTGLGIGSTAVLLGHLWQRVLSGKRLSRGRWLAATAVSGLLWGVGSGLLTLALMAVKTGLHAHGPEFTPDEIVWVWRQTPLWAAVGLLAGLGMGMLVAGRRQDVE